MASSGKSLLAFAAGLAASMPHPENRTAQSAGPLISGDEAAKLLGVPKLAMGQLVFEGKLNMPQFDQFSESQVRALIGNPCLSRLS